MWIYYVYFIKQTTKYTMRYGVYSTFSAASRVIMTAKQINNTDEWYIEEKFVKPELAQKLLELRQKMLLYEVWYIKENSRHCISVHNNIIDCIKAMNIHKTLWYGGYFHINPNYEYNGNYKLRSNP